MASKAGAIGEAQRVALKAIELGDEIAAILKYYADLGSGDVFSDGDPEATPPVSSDFAGVRGDVFTKASFVTAISTFQAIDTLLNSGHRVNLRKIAG